MNTCYHEFISEWYTAKDTKENGNSDVILEAQSSSAEDVNVTCVVNAGNIQFQVKDNKNVWFTPEESAYTVAASNLVRIPRANMPEIRVLATEDATFSIAGHYQ